MADNTTDDTSDPLPALRDSLSGFIASELKLTATRRGDAKFYAKVGQEHGYFADDGSYQKLPTTFHDLTAYKGAGIRAYERLVKGDHFVARGRLEQYESKVSDQTKHRFVAHGFDHDIAQTQYEDDGTPRHAAPECESPVPTSPTRATDRSSRAIGL